MWTWLKLRRDRSPTQSVKTFRIRWASYLFQYSIKYEINISNVRSVWMFLLKFVKTFLNRNVPRSHLKSARDGFDTL